MNLESAISNYWGKKEMLPILQYIGSNQEKYDVAIELMLSPDTRIHQKAAWVVQHASEKNPWLINKHIGRITKNLYKKDIHDSVKRATLRSLGLIEIPEENWGELVEVCFQLIIENEPTGVKMFAMCVLHSICKKVPELNTELKVILQDQLPFGTPGFKSRANKILAEIS